MPEPIEVAPSEDNGNISAMEMGPVTPSESTPTVETPAEIPVEPTVPEEKLFELPDGRKVDGETLAKEWKDNFLPEFTRKSQTLSEIEKAQNIKNPPTDPYADPNYIPKNYEELITEAENRTLAKIEAKQQEEIQRQQQVENEVASQLSTIKQTDKNLDENALFLHANKYGFRDLPTAYKNMKDMAALVKTTQQTVAKNITKRADPVSTTSSQPSGAKINPSHFQNAVDYMRAIKGQ